MTITRSDKKRSALKLRNRAVKGYHESSTPLSTTSVLGLVDSPKKSGRSAPISGKRSPILGFKPAKSATAKTATAYTPHKFVHKESKTLLFVKPRPHASTYHKILRSLNLTTLRCGAEIKRDPAMTLPAAASAVY